MKRRKRMEGKKNENGIEERRWNGRRKKMEGKKKGDKGKEKSR